MTVVEEELEPDYRTWVPFVAHSDEKGYSDGVRERSWWIGKPWRRVELLRIDSFYRDELVDSQYVLSVSLGSSRLGWHVHGALTRAVGMDYSDEPHQ